MREDEDADGSESKWTVDGSTTGAQSNRPRGAPRRRAPPRGPAVDAWAMEMELLAPTGALAMQAAGGRERAGPS
jgi:hypothetical protein